MDIPEGEALDRALADAYKVYQDNIRRTGELIYRLTLGAKGSVPEQELLETAEEAISRCRFSAAERSDGGK